jgi:hypothetical protein
MNDRHDELQREYVEILDELDRIAAQQPGTWLALRPVRWGGEGVQIDATPQAQQLRGEEQALVGRLQAVEQQYQDAGGDVDDLHRLVPGRQQA